MVYLEQIVALEANSTQGSQQAVEEVDRFESRHGQKYECLTLLSSVHTERPNVHKLTIQGSFYC